MGTLAPRRFRGRLLPLVGCLLLGLIACGGEEKPAAAGPAQAPTPTSELPAGLQIEVEIDGAPAPPIDAALLRRVEPDFRNGGRRSWRIEGLLGPAAARPNSVLEVENADGVATIFPPATRRMWEPVLSLNLRGDVLVSLRAREQASRAFHGRGGNRGRPGSPRRQIRDVAKLKLYARERGAGAARGRGQRRPEVVVAVFMDGEPTVSWKPSDLGTVETLVAVGGPSGGVRPSQAWSLREVVQTLIGGDPVVTKLQGRGGRGFELDPSDWRNAEKVPVLRLNRRGEFKFEWHTPSGQRLPGAGVRGVSEIHLRSGPT